MALTGTVTRNGAAPTVGFGQVFVERAAEGDRAVLANITGTKPCSVLVTPATDGVVYPATGTASRPAHAAVTSTTRA